MSLLDKFFLRFNFTLMNTYTYKFSKALAVLGLALAFSLPVHGASSLKELVLYFPLLQVQDYSREQNNAKLNAVIVSNSPSLESMQTTRQLTISVWIKPDSIPYEFPVIVSKGSSTQIGENRGGYQLFLNSNGDNDIVFNSGDFQVTTHNANGKWINNHVSQWIHVAVTIDDQLQTAKIYVNGKPTNDEFIYGSMGSLKFDVPSNLYIGTSDPANTQNASDFDGDIRELMIFNRALTCAEIKRIYASTKGAALK